MVTATQQGGDVAPGTVSAALEFTVSLPSEHAPSHFFTFRGYKQDL